MEQFAIYLWSISDNIRNLLFFVATIDLVGVFFTAITEDCKPRLFKALIVTGVFLLMLAVLIPSKRDLAILLLYPTAKEGVQKVAQSETAEQIQEIGSLYLQQKIKELKEEQGYDET